MRFRLRTLLTLLAAAAAVAGAGRHCYDVQVMPSRRDAAWLASPELRGVTGRWSGAPNAGWSWRRRIQLVWLEEVEDFERASERLGELTAVEEVQVLGRQIMPHSVAFQRDGRDPVIEALRRHSTLQRLLVDASVRGAPLGDQVELFDRDDLATLQAALPNLEVVWMEVH